IAAIQLEAAALLAKSPEQLIPDQRLTLERVQAEALAGADRREEALVRFEQLARMNPDSGAVQKGFAQLLLTSSNKSELQQALEQWRIVASHTRPHTPQWFEAKYSVALAQFKLGDRAGAAILLRFLLETPPGIDRK